MHVALLTTGRMELVGLPTALGRLFPGHEFTSVPRMVGSNEPWDGFTSAPLPIANPKAPTNLDKLVAAMAATLVPGRRGDPPDLLVLLDDLELANAHQPAVVVAELRSAVQRHLASLDSGLATRVSAALRDRASFHLAAPMAESWLFADPAGPGNAGAPPAHLPPRLVANVDPEQFHTDDPAYDVDDGCTCARWTDLSELQQSQRSKTEQPEWLKAQRQQRPKSYLAWLARDPSAKKCSTYREVHPTLGQPSGARALAGLDWEAALGNATHMTYLRSLVLDLADALNAPVPQHLQGQTASLTCRHTLPAAPTLRNL